MSEKFTPEHFKHLASQIDGYCLTNDELKDAIHTIECMIAFFSASSDNSMYLITSYLHRRLSELLNFERAREISSIFKFSEENKPSSEAKNNSKVKKHLKLY